MTFKPGVPRPANAGRKKGTPNKVTVDLLERMQEVAAKRGVENFHPVVAMAEIALDPEWPMEIRSRMYSESSKYVAPQRKAVEHSGPGGEPIEVKLDFVDKIVGALAKSKGR